MAYGLQRAFDETVGGLQTRGGFLSRLTGSPTAQGLDLLLSALSLALNTAQGVKELTSGLAQQQPTAVVVQIGSGMGVATPSPRPHGVNGQTTPPPVIDAEVIQPEDHAR